MNKTNIEWCDMTWNPVTGCYHGCEYCYARRIAHRFRNQDEESMRTAKFLRGNYKNGGNIVCLESEKDPFPVGFVPTFHRNRLDEPLQRKKPAKIFVSSMGDLFGDWVPEEWTDEVFEACRKAPQHTYFFLTKNPYEYRMQIFRYMICCQEDMENYIYDKNFWYGASFTNQEELDNKGFDLAYGGKNANTFLSLEPFLGRIVLSDFMLERIKWIIIGAQTGPKSVQPKKEWVQSIINQAREYNIPLFLKNNLKWPEKIQEWPGVK